jgi:hypothetical protein
MITGAFLNKVKMQAIRKKVFFSELDAVERAMITVASKIVRVVKSITLNRILTLIVNKILTVVKSPLKHFSESFRQLIYEKTLRDSMALGFDNLHTWIGEGFLKYKIIQEYFQPNRWNLYKGLQ